MYRAETVAACQCALDPLGGYALPKTLEASDHRSVTKGVLYLEIRINPPILIELMPDCSLLVLGFLEITGKWVARRTC